MSIFNDTKIAFAHKTNTALRKAYWMFKTIENPTLTNLSIPMVNFGIKYKIPFVKSIVKHTLFAQFVGGETREESLKVVADLHKNHIGSIFDYAIEGKEDEATFDTTCHEIKENIVFAKNNQGIPFVVFKPTGFGRFDLYAKKQTGESLSNEEEMEWERIEKRFYEVCALAEKENIIVMIDAEETWIQNVVDSLVNTLMERFNTKRAIVWNTIQMYRTKRIEHITKDIQNAKEKGYFIGYKIVRGAYMEKERNRAQELKYEDPIQPNKKASDDNYNAGIALIMENLEVIAAFFGTHNEFSTQLVINILKNKKLPNNYPNIHFGQLYGMSDNITYFLGSNEYNATKYLPYGPVSDVVPYLTRRARENTSVAGQTGRELSLIATELKRRKL